MSFLQHHQEISNLDAIYLRECQIPQSEGSVPQGWVDYQFNIKNLILNQPDGRDAEGTVYGGGGAWRTDSFWPWANPVSLLHLQRLFLCVFLFVCCAFFYGGSIT